MAGAVPRRGLVSLFKQGWHEIPEVIGSSFIGLIGLVGAIGSVYYYYQKDGDNRRFKSHIVIYRPDDPRVAKIRKD